MSASQPVNSGCLICSLTWKEDGEKRYMKQGNVYGPLAEIKSNFPKGSESGKFYGQARGTDFLNPSVKRVRANKHTEWNHIRIPAEGPRLRTWINGKAIADILNHEIFAEP